MVNRPQVWPSLMYQASELWLRLGAFAYWSLFLEVGTFLIAQSVTKEDMVQSYVALGPPTWLQHLLDSEKGTCTT